MLLNFKAETKSLRPRPKGPEAKAEPRGYEVEIEANAKILALRPVWPRGFNISAAKSEVMRSGRFLCHSFSPSVCKITAKVIS